MKRDWMPDTINGLVAFDEVFTPGVTAAATTLNIDAPTVAALQAASTAMRDSVAIGKNPATRTAGTIAQMHLSIQLYKQVVRKVVRVIRGQRNITDTQLLNLGLTVPKPRTNIQPPAAAPSGRVVKRWGPFVEMQFGAAGAPGRGSRPYGCAGLNVYAAVGQVPPDISGWMSVGFSSKLRVEVKFDDALAPGTKVFICANWQTQRGATSVACAPIETTIDGTGMQMTPQTLKIAA